MKLDINKPIPKIQGRVNHVFNGEMIYLMARMINRLVDTVNALVEETVRLRSCLDKIEKEGKSKQ